MLPLRKTGLAAQLGRAPREVSLASGRTQRTQRTEPLPEGTVSALLQCVERGDTRAEALVRTIEIAQKRNLGLDEALRRRNARERGIPASRAAPLRALLRHECKVEQPTAREFVPDQVPTSVESPKPACIAEPSPTSVSVLPVRPDTVVNCNTDADTDSDSDADLITVTWCQTCRVFRDAPRAFCVRGGHCLSQRRVRARYFMCPAGHRTRTMDAPRPRLPCSVCGAPVEAWRRVARESSDHPADG